MGGDPAAAEDGDANGGEEPFGDPRELRPHGLGFAGPVHASGPAEASPPVQGDPVGHGDCGHSRQRAEALCQAIQEEAAFARRGVAFLGQVKERRRKPTDPEVGNQ